MKAENCFWLFFKEAIAYDDGDTNESTTASARLEGVLSTRCGRTSLLVNQYDREKKLAELEYRSPNENLRKGYPT